jgi:hypothetical protein
MKSQHYILSLALGIIFFCSSIADGVEELKPDEVVQLDHITFESGEKWLAVKVGFTPKRQHPIHDKKLATKSSQGGFIEPPLNEDFLDDVKLDIYVCFRNETRKKRWGEQTPRKRLTVDYQEPELFDYYHAEVEILTMKLNARKELLFLLSKEIAERDGFDRLSANNPVGWIVEMTVLGATETLKFKNPTPGIEFKVKSKKFSEFKSEDKIAIESFKKYAKEKSKEKEGLLVPAHLVNAAHLTNAPAVRIGPTETSSGL